MCEGKEGSGYGVDNSNQINLKLTGLKKLNRNQLAQEVN